MSGARQGRRRRILQEEVLSASREMPAYSSSSASNAEGGEGRRYALDEGSLGSALAKRHFPSRAVAPALVLLASTAMVAGLAAAHQYRDAVATYAGTRFASLFDVTSNNSLATWLASASMVGVALLAAMILAVRRCRVDDYQGCHRLWRGAILAALLLSVDAVTNLHAAVADAVSTVSGVRLMSGGAEWWLGIGALVFGWVGVRVLLDVKESRLSLATLVAAAIAGGVACVGPLAGLGGAAGGVVAHLAQLACYLLVASSLVAYTRMLRIDVAAGVASKPQKSRTSEVKLAVHAAPDNSAAPAAKPKEAEAAQPTRRQEKQAKAAQQADQATSQWTDGSDGYSDEFGDDDGSRKLSKSERKRLRKQKAQRRAA